MSDPVNNLALLDVGTELSNRLADDPTAAALMSRMLSAYTDLIAEQTEKLQEFERRILQVDDEMRTADVYVTTLEHERNVYRDGFLASVRIRVGINKPGDKQDFVAATQMLPEELKVRN